MATLSVSQTHDYSSDTLSNVTDIVFSGSNLKQVTFDSAQFDNVQISTGVHVFGSPGQDEIDVKMASAGTFSAAGWTVSNFEPVADGVRIDGSTGADTITGPGGGAGLFGSDGDDTLNSGDGNDNLVGGNGADVLAGGAGDDLFSYFLSDEISAGERVDGGDGTDTIRVGQGDADSYDFRQVQVTGVEDLEFTSNSSTDVTLAGSQIGAGAIQRVAADELNAHLIVAGSSVNLSGVVFVHWQATAQHITIEGLPATNDVLTGSDEPDTINGGNLASSGNDTIEGGGGADVLDGFGGDDTFRYVAASDAAAGETVNGGTGVDKLQLFNTAIIDFSVVNLSAVEQVAFASGTSTAIFAGSQIGNAGAGEITAVIGGAGTGHLVVDGASVDLSAVTFSNWTAGTDGVTINGTTGGDTLIGSSQDDIMIGGAGDDTYGANNTGDVVEEEPGGGADTVQTTLGAYSLENLANVENLTFVGGGPFTGTGNALANTITGGTGNDVLDGRGGADKLLGLDGADTFQISSPGDVAAGESIDGGNGIDTLQLLNAGAVDFSVVVLGVEALQFVSGSNTAEFQSHQVSHLVPSGQKGVPDLLTGIVSVAGSAQADHLVLNGPDTDLSQLSLSSWTAGIDTIAVDGTDGPDKLTGSSQNDTLDGGDGNDTLNGGPGADHLIGGAGDDTYVVDNAGDAVTENAGDGTDTIVTTLNSYSLLNLPNVENLTFVGTGAFTGIGNAAANTITGDTGNDVLYGKGGADTLVGGAGDDLLFVDDAMDQTIEAAGQGSDRVLTSVSYTLGAGQSIETFTTADGTATANLSLVGNALAQTIIGNAGNNVLNDGGVGGHDALKGLDGDDRYVVNNSSDTIIESTNGGTDQVLASTSFTLGAGQSVEFLLTTNAAATTPINFGGNALAQTIIGNAGNNIINDGGVGGIDTLEGLGGSDSYVVANAGDHVIEAAGGGSDTVRTSVSFTLGASQSIEALTPLSYASTTNINLVGNTLAQTIIGNAGNNILNDGGAGGGDTLQGLGGSDSYVVNNSNDSVLEAANGGSDTVRTSTSYTLGAGQSIETLTPVSYASTAAINLTGNALAQTIIGDAGANVINGAAGNDTLKGLGGNDTFVFNTALDASTNVDTILDFTHGTDKIELDHAIFTALAAANSLPAADFTTGAPTTPDQHIIYNTATGALSYDDDGSGAHAAVAFAALSGHPALASADIFVV